MKIRIPKPYNAMADKEDDNFMEVAAIYPEIQIDDFMFRAAFVDGKPRILVLVASTLVNGKFCGHWWNFDKGQIHGDFNQFVGNSKKKLKDIFLEELEQMKSPDSITGASN